MTTCLYLHVVQQRQATVHKLMLIERDIDVHTYIAFGADN